MICKCKFNNATGSSNQKWNNETYQSECKSFCKKYFCWNTSTCLCENSKNIFEESVIVYGYKCH